MKKLLLSILIGVCAVASASAQKTFECETTPTWNIDDGFIYGSYENHKSLGVILTFPNPKNFTITYFSGIVVDYLVYKDDVEVPDTAEASGQSSTLEKVIPVKFSYDFLEGHSYRIVTTKSYLTQANLATLVTDTLAVNNDSHSISFSIKGPELVKTINVEAKMSLAITDQFNPITYSLIDADGIKESLGISTMEEATIYGLQANGAYVPYEYAGPDYFDGGRDADGNYTIGYGNNRFAGGNSTLLVYRIKLNETCDTIEYFFEDSWKEYDPEEPESIPGTGMQPVKRRLPDTHINRVIWDWDNGDGTTTKFTRTYRCDVGSDYKASFVVKTSEKYVLINATMHFVSEEDYLNPPVATKPGDVNEDDKVDISDIVAIINNIAGTATYAHADVNGDEKVDISDIVAVINIIASGEQQP